MYQQWEAVFCIRVFALLRINNDTYLIIKSYNFQTRRLSYMYDNRATRNEEYANGNCKTISNNGITNFEQFPLFFNCWLL